MKSLGYFAGRWEAVQMEARTVTGWKLFKYYEQGSFIWIFNPKGVLLEKIRGRPDFETLYFCFEAIDCYQQNKFLIKFKFMKKQIITAAYVRLSNGVFKEKNAATPEELQSGVEFNPRTASAKHVREYWYWKKVYMSTKEWSTMQAELEKESQPYLDTLEKGKQVSLGKIHTIIRCIDDPARFDPVSLRFHILSYPDLQELQIFSEDDVDLVAQWCKFYHEIQIWQSHLKQTYYLYGENDKSAHLRTLELINKVDDWMEF